jgi:hypothetical protein
VVLALAAVVVDPVNAPWLTDLLGAQASAKLAAVGAMLAALGRAVFATTPPTAP